MSLIYCYGIIEGDSSLEKCEEVRGFGGEIFLIKFKDLSAVVSSVSEEEFSQDSLNKNVKNMEWLTKNAPVHEDVVTRVMGEVTIIPMRFCTIFKTEDHILSMLEEKYADLKYNLYNMKDKFEMNVKVYVDFEKVKKQISDPEIETLEEEMKSKTPGHAYMLKQKIDLLLKGRVQEKLRDEKSLLLKKFHTFSDSVKENNLLTNKGKEMFLNVAVLVYKTKVDEFKKKVDGGDIRLEYYITGPFAPYSFIK